MTPRQALWFRKGFYMIAVVSVLASERMRGYAINSLSSGQQTSGGQMSRPWLGRKTPRTLPGHSEEPPSKRGAFLLRRKHLRDVSRDRGVTVQPSPGCCRWAPCPLTDRGAKGCRDLDSLNTEHADIQTDARALGPPGAPGGTLRSCQARGRGLGLLG